MVEVIYDGGLGNNLFQYCFGRILAERLGYKLVAAPLAGFPRTFEAVDGCDYSGCDVLTLRGQRPDLTFVEEPGLRRHVLLTGYFQRYEYYAPRASDVKAWMAVDDPHDLRIGSDDVVLTIRRGRDYIPRFGLPLSYYETALNSIRHDRVFICTNEPDDPFIRYLQKKYRANVRAGSFQGGKILPSYWAGALDNLTFIRRFNNIVISNSSFSWWAAYLSEARVVIYPRPASGLWSSTDPVSRDISLEVDEERYRYLECEPYRSEFFSERLRNRYDGLVVDVKREIKKMLPSALIAQRGSRSRQSKISFH